MIFERKIKKWRKTLAGTLVLLGFVASASLAMAEVRIDITRGHLEPLPIAISDFYGKEIRDGEIGADIAAVVSGNLERSGLFKPVDKGSVSPETEIPTSSTAFFRLARDQCASAGERQR